MNTSQLSAELARWTSEYKMISSSEFTVPEALFGFLATRLTELGIAEEDPDVVTIEFKRGEFRKVRIVNFRASNPPLLVYRQTDGLRLEGLCPPSDVIMKDRTKLSAILTRIDNERNK